MKVGWDPGGVILAESAEGQGRLGVCIISDTGAPETAERAKGLKKMKLRKIIRASVSRWDLMKRDWLRNRRHNSDVGC